MPLIQSIFIVIVMLVLLYLLIDGWISRAVWVKGARDGLFSFRHLAHRRGREDEPRLYWSAMGFYALALICLVVLLLLN